MLALALSSGPASTASPGPMASPAPSLIPSDRFEFAATGPLHEPRIHAAAVLLHDGRVIVIGGYDVASAEIWDPATGQWSMSGSMSGPSEGATATLLPDGRVLVVGGHDNGGSRPAEVWDPTTGAFSPVGAPVDDLPQAVPSASPGPVASADGASLTRLTDGRVLVAGGWVKADPSCGPVCKMLPTDSAAIWDPATGVSTPVARMNQPRTEHDALLLPDGRVLLVGSHTHGDVDSTAELFQPGTAPLP